MKKREEHSWFHKYFPDSIDLDPQNSQIISHIWIQLQTVHFLNQSESPISYKTKKIESPNTVKAKPKFSNTRKTTPSRWIHQNRKRKGEEGERICPRNKSNRFKSEQRSRYKSLLSKPLHPCRYLDSHSLNKLGIRDNVFRLLNNLGWVEMLRPVKGFENFTYEFLSSIAFKKDRLNFDNPNPGLWISIMRCLLKTFA